jgi:thymidylate kinase
LGGIAQADGHPSWNDVYDTDAVELMSAVELRQMVYSTLLPISFRGQIIVTDTYTRRWLASALAWGAAPDKLISVYRTLPPPDLSIHLEVPVSTAFERILAREKGDHLRTGGIERLQRLADSYRLVADLVDYPCSVVSTKQPPEVTAGEICELVRAAARAMGDERISSSL